MHMQEEEEAEEEGGGQGGVEREEREQKKILTRARIHKATSARRTLLEKACAKGPRRSIENRRRVDIGGLNPERDT